MTMSSSRHASIRAESESPASQASSVLSTLNSDGSRRWMKPRPSDGRFVRARRAVAWLLIVVFTVIPYIKVGGAPLLLLDIPTRRFTVFGVTFLPYDTLLLALLMLSIFVTVFLVTSMLGRVWCGWGCPQTVYMEFVFRPIERFFDGVPGRAKRGSFVGSGGATFLKFVAYFLVACFLAHTFLAYFVGVERLLQWVTQSPLKHPTGFFVMALTTALMLFDFGFFREQVCLVACPYGRFQSVMFDRRSLIVTYDPKRGEPRGKGRKGDLSLNVLRGDCVDCGLCVATCPTGIDIRNGLQMECVHCAQCIDACDAVMTKLGKPRGLIRYGSQAQLAGEHPRVLRPRVVIYSSILAVLVTALVTLLVNRTAANVLVLRARGAPFVAVSETETGNNVRVKVTNRTTRTAEYSVSISGPEGAHLRADESAMVVDPVQSKELSVMLVVPNAAFERGRAEVTVTISGPDGFDERVPFRMVGPGSMHAAAKHDEHDEHVKEHSDDDH
ncbi:hypothetical protein PHYC_00087 [Phycisphaerales bacterium]|nr:hypothetical protein PHYC_00087 [Phycisphaerales bacterium]